MASILDAFALVAITLNEPAAGEVEVALRRADCRITALNFAEAMDQLGRVHGQPDEDLRAAFVPLLSESVAVIDVDEHLAWRAAELRRRHYRRRTSEVSLADCVLLAAARPGDSILTADPPLARAARKEGMDVVALPDSRGRRP